jgi:hypothetical protein
LVLIFVGDLGEICFAVRRSVIAPGPPTFAAFTLIKLLPFAAVIITHHGRSPINPNPDGVAGARSTVWTTKFLGVNSLSHPIRGSRIKCFHAGFDKGKVGKNPKFSPISTI